MSLYFMSFWKKITSKCVQILIVVSFSAYDTIVNKINDNNFDIQ